MYLSSNQMFHGISSVNKKSQG